MAAVAVNLQHEVLCLLAKFTPSEVVGKKKIRVGNNAGDGGYVMLDDFAGIGGAVSAGIGRDVSWDSEIADRGIDVFQFDSTVAGPPVLHNGRRFRFFRRSLAPRAIRNSDSIRSLVELIPGRLIFKIDIEGAEWDVLDAATFGDFHSVSQLIVEFHGFSNIPDSVWRERAMRVMTKLSCVFQVFHVHGNNYSQFHIHANVPFPDVVEVSFANQSMYQFIDSTETFPTSLDRPNGNHCPDIFLGALRFLKGL